MSIVVVGSIAFDTITTPFGTRKKALGGAANYFSMSARFFSPVELVGVVGEDFPKQHLEFLAQNNIDISGVERALGKSFHWQGQYSYDLNEAKTLKTELNVFKDFKPNLPKKFTNSEIIFCANIDPELQIHVLKQMSNPKIKALDTMNYWIENKNKKLKEAISLIDILLINDAEIRELTGEHNIIKATKAAGKMGARIIVVKRGEYGVLLSIDNHIAFVPGYPIEDVFDPTGAGDTFAGGFLGYLAQQKNYNLANLKQALLTGTVMSSFVIEKFSFDRLLEIDLDFIEQRKKELLGVMSF